MERGETAIRTIRDVAKHLNISVSTVSRCLNNYPDVNPDTRNRILAAIADLNYVPNDAARNITRKSTRTIGLTIPDIQDPFFSANADAVEEVSRKQGYELIYGSLARSSERLVDFIKRAAEMRLDGLIITPDAWDDGLLAALARLEMPVVALRRKPPAGVDIPFVDADHYGGARAMVEYLVSIGHRRIGHVEHSTMLGAERRRGYLDVMREHGLEPHIRATGSISGRLHASVHNGRRATAELLAEAGDLSAVFVASDLLAMGTMEHCARAGIRVPDDLSVAGFDNLEYAEFYWFQFTTMAVDRPELGRRAANLLLRMIQGKVKKPKPFLLETELIVRNSTKPFGKTTT